LQFFRCISGPTENILFNERDKLLNRDRISSLATSGNFRLLGFFASVSKNTERPSLVFLD